ncbi:MAG TPA: ATP-binding protein [Candidatus Saccharimonadales bacterium]|nr:ATP-binding protein [Candidatus Saccharimonadales bacterium]
MSKPTLYLMLGYPGAGKTTVAEHIATLTGAVHLNSDQFRLHMFDKPLGITDAEHDRMYEMLDHITERTLSSGKSVIYDANLNRYAHRKEKYDIAERTGAQARLVWVTTDEPTARQRATVEAPKHPRHRPFGNMKTEVFARLISEIEPPKETEQTITIDGNLISYTKIKKALELRH